MMTCLGPYYHIQYSGELHYLSYTSILTVHYTGWYSYNRNLKNKARVYVNLLDLTKISRH